MSETSTTSVPWYVPATRWDALSMLAAGMLLPASAMPRPSGVLARAAAGFLPLVSGGIYADWLRAESDEGAEIPILFELDVSPHEPSTMVTERVALAAVPAVVPLCRVPRLHLRSDREAEEFRSRRFDNVRPEDARFEISPALFDSSGPEIAPVLTWLKDLKDGVAAADMDDADAVAGAVLAALTPPGLSVEELQVRREIVLALAETESDESAADAVIRALDRDAWLSTSKAEDRLLLRTMIGVLSASDTDGRVGGRRLLDDIRSAVDELHDGGDHSELEKNLGVSGDILRSKRELQPLRPDAGLRSAKSLLLLLLRPEPEQSLTWLSEMSADPLSGLGAVILSGYLTGARRLPVTFKDAPASDPVRRLAADRINARHGRLLGTFGLKHDRAVELRVESDDARPGARLLLGGHEATRYEPPSEMVPGKGGDSESTEPTAGEPQLSLDGAQDAGETDSINESEVDPLIEPLVALLGAAADPRSDEARTCSLGCVELGWPELVTTVIPLDEHGALIAGKCILVPGLPQLSWQLDLDGLRSRLLAEDAGAARGAFAEAISAASKAPRPARRRKAPPRKTKRTKSE